MPVGYEIQVLLYLIFYGGATMLSLVSCLYLLFRHGNAFAQDVTSPVRVRRWTAALFAFVFHSHLSWAMIGYPLIVEEVTSSYIYAMGVDAIFLPPLMMATILSMLQDRRRSVLPLFVSMIPVVVLVVLSYVHKADYIRLIAFPYILAIYTVFFIYMLFAVKQYGRWLRDNYADLEHKEVWQNIILFSILSLLFCSCFFNDGGMLFEYFIQVVNIAIISILLWRVETLEQLEEPAVRESVYVPASAVSYVGALLDEHCEKSQLYLRNDLSLSDLTESIGTNRTYLSQYFADEGLNFNTYINNLRIRHFLKLYDESLRTQRVFTAQSLAFESGFRSYRTFSDSFKRLMGQTVSDWVKTRS